MKNIVLKIDAPLLPANADITHVGTSWQVSKSPDFSNRTYFIIESLSDTASLLEYRASINIEDSDTLYLRTKYHYNSNKESNWSKIMSVKGSQVGLKLSSTIVLTPKVTYDITHDISDEGNLILKTSPMELYAGVGKHKSTTWEVTDLDNNIIFKRAEDTDNLLEIVLDLKLINLNKAYVIKAKHHTTTNTDSNFGKNTIVNFSGNIKLFELTTPYELMPEKWFYFDLKLYTNKYMSIDLILEDEFGNILASNYSQTSRSPRIYTGKLKYFRYYTIKARLRLADNKYTGFVRILTSMPKPNLLINIDKEIPYLNKYTFNQEFLLGGETAQSVSEIYTGTVLLAKQGTNAIQRYVIVNNKLQLAGNAFTLDDEFDPLDIPYINIVPVHSGRVLVDYSLDKVDSLYRKSVFKLYDYNAITHEFTELKSVTRPNERFTTGVSTSLAVVNKDYAYYIPNMELTNNVILNDLCIYSIHINTLTITKVTDLPVSLKRNVSMVALDESRLLVFGGASFGTKYSSNNNYNRTNNKVWIYNISTNNWSELIDLPADVPNGINNFQAYTRRDEKIVMFNSSEEGSAIGNQNTLLFDPVTLNFQYIENDQVDNLRYRTTIVLRNGDIFRISNRAVDPQKVYRYVSNTYTNDQLVDNTIIDSITDLVVNEHTTINIESPYRYNTIKVLGTDYNNTGVLRWLNGDKLREFKYRDLIITRDTTITQDIYDAIESYDSITVLEDANFTVQNILVVPNNTDYTVEAPISATAIRIGTDSTLAVTTN